MELDSLKTIGFEITGKCNFNCVHCYLGAKNNNFLAKEFIMNVIKKIGSNFHSIYLTGGEPLLHPDFIDIYTNIRKQGFLITILTNGSLINDDIWDLFKESMPHKIEISLYGMTEITNEKVTGIKGSFDVVMSNIIKLNKMYQNFILKYNVLTINYHELDTFINFCKKNNISFSISTQIIPDLFGNQDTTTYRLDPQKSVSLLQRLGLDLRTVNEVQHICDAGDNIFIDSNKVLRGCPVLKTDHDLKIEKECDSSLMLSTMKSIKTFCNTLDDKICPGWIALEDKEKVKSYIDQVAFYKKNLSLKDTIKI